MSDKKISYVFSVQGEAAGSRVNQTFICDESRAGFDEACRRLDDLSLGLGRAVGQAMRPIVEGSKGLKEGIPHASSGKTDRASGSVTVTAAEKI